MGNCHNHQGARRQYLRCGDRKGHMSSSSQTTQTRRVGSLTPEQSVIPGCCATTRRKRPRYYLPCTTTTR
ncbi:unnamed protein product [Hymenolepis diminuta]|uniref:Uncharacterized protein n=1 Tax=Hymenolepis diminuta TaxID=6216 RepID=A0A564Z4X2_HYMDI|nr:unnamed protein product [Hymenolepis diminuta]